MRYTAVYLFVAFASSAAAQWLHYPTPGIPRTRDGKPNLSAPAPKVNGRPDLSGVWQIEPTPLEELKRLFGSVETFDVPGDDASLYSKYFLNVLADYSPSESPMLPGAAKILRNRQQRDSAELPYTKCLPAGVPLSETLPFPFKVVETPSLTLIVHESDSSVRQIYTDGRKHTPDPQPTWNGYSVGHWELDTLVIDTVGFNDLSWLDAMGTPHSEALHTVERMRRTDFGHLDVQVTFEDPMMYSKSFIIHYRARLLADSDIQENVCAENEKDLRHFR